MAETAGVNREYKDRVFKFIFGNPDNREWTLSLYNAVNGSSYSDPNDIKITTIENAVYLSMKNDVSFLIDDVMNFYEHQASVNPNLPMRFLIYAGMVYGRYVDENDKYLRFSSTLQKAPTPKCVCFYNGTANQTDKVMLSLSDAFQTGTEPDIEVRVTVYNINYGHNRELMGACASLNDYSFFVDRVRNYKKLRDSLEEAVDAAINDLPDDSVIKPFFKANRAEVKRMCITEYDEERTLAEKLEEGRIMGRSEGREEGMEIGTLKTLLELVKDGIISISDAAARAHMSVEEFENKAASYSV